MGLGLGKRRDDSHMPIVLLLQGRADDAARYARARKTSTKREGGRKKRPMLGCI